MISNYFGKQKTQGRDGTLRFLITNYQLRI